LVCSADSITASAAGYVPWQRKWGPLPPALADSLLLLFEGAFASAQIFGPGGPAARVAATAQAPLALLGDEAPGWVPKG
jgi:hypothetical protein